MKFVIALTAALALSFFMVGIVAQVSEAQAEKVLEACEKGQSKIPAGKLPSEVSLKKCPIGDRPIVDNGVEALLPEAGEGVHAEVLSADGSQELVVARRKDGTVELNKVGNEKASSDGAGIIQGAASSGRNECRDRAYNLTRWKVYRGLAYRYNARSTPRYLGARVTARAIRRGAVNIVETQNPCRMGDKVEASVGYRGSTRDTPNILASGRCTRNDGNSVVAFGRLRSGLGVACTYFTLAPGYDKVVSADIQLDRSGTRWTVRPFARACRGRYDIQAVATHEWGHVFGLGHVSERRHPNLTMSPIINGACQASERTLGRGDVLGLARKYR